MKERYAQFLENAKTLSDIFEVVKSAAWDVIGRNRGGLMLALADLGNHPQGFFGAFHPVGTNIIVMNRVPLQRVLETQPGIYNSYAFHVLMHEYLHTLGYLDEGEVRRLTFSISKKVFGESHPATQLAADTRKYFPSLTYPNIAWEPKELDLELVEKFDRSSASYIA